LGGAVQHLRTALDELDRHDIQPRDHDIGNAQVPDLHPALHYLPLNILFR
jgi:hypothetical protein